MKQLQNNFTTPEQSKRLLELGVPRGSADEYRDKKGYRHPLEGILDVELFFQNFPDSLPCWSACRLMEIFDICCVKEQTSNSGWCSYRKLYKDQTYIGYVLYVFTINKMQGFLDFSKLED